MLAGHPPFLGSTARELIAHHTLDPVPRLRTIRPDLPEPIDRAIAKALAKTPADRFATTPAFAAAVTSHADAPQPKRVPWTVALVGLGLAAVASSYALFSSRFSGGAASLTSTAQPSIAVLAFRNLGNDPNNDAMSDGISEEIATTLGNVEGLSVKAPRAAFGFKGKALSSGEIGRRLGVRYLIDGGVSRSGNRLRITVQLVLAANDSTLWAANYQRPDSDVFAVQGEIARAVSEKLRVQLTGVDRTTIAKRATTGSPEAHDLYLQGRYFFEKRDSASLAKARGYFEQAIAKDSTYAVAYAGLGDTYMHWSAFGFMRPRDAFPVAQRYVARAIFHDSSLAEVHASLAFAALYYAWDWATAGREFHKALQLGPTSPSTHLWDGIYMLAVDSVPAAITETRRAVQLDPFGSVTNTRLVTLLFYGHDYKGALDQANHTLELDSNFFQIRTERARVYVRLGRCAEAMADLTRSQKQQAPQLTGVRGYIYAKCGRTAEAQSELDNLLAEARAGRYVPHYGLAVIYAGLGNKARAIAELDVAYRDREWIPNMLRLEPAFEDLRSDPRFTALLTKVGLAS
jgi:serine/threonine-protein kinase